MARLLKKGEVVTLFLSDTKKIYFKTAIIYFVFSVITFIFSIVYSLFSHEVYSDYLTFAFLFPLIGGTLLYLLLCKLNSFEKWPYNFYNAGIATITVGSILRGVNEIAGADTLYYMWFYLVGIIFIVLSLILLLIEFLLRRKNK
jgi:hypothetical protein